MKGLLESVGLASGVLGPIIFVVVTLALGANRPHYRPIRTFISQLCLDEGGPWKLANFLDSGRWQSANFVVSGLLIALFGVTLSPVWGIASVRWWQWLPVIWAGVGIIGIGIIHDDWWLSYPPGAPDYVGKPVTAHGWAHLSVSALTGLGLVVAISSFARHWDLQWLLYSVATIFFFLGSYALALYSGHNSGRREPPGGRAGLFQRLSMFSAILWIAVLAWRLL
jgi:hypothetical protein